MGLTPGLALELSSLLLDWLNPGQCDPLCNVQPVELKFRFLNPRGTKHSTVQQHSSVAGLAQ
jgi:hypothetical protein